MHCVANGHDIVALATLTPEPGIDELDSHLYQSVGTHLIPLIAQSLDVPLFTRTIRGKAISQGPEYGSRMRGGEGSGVGGDETEDLYSLLQDVLMAYPDATALSSGAILSTYQRLRIEHVCLRLGLTSLSYLWQGDQNLLLDKMLESGVEAVIMKVAGIGLGVDIVGKQLNQIRPLLARLEAQYGSHPAGEGGEYETLTLSTPLFSHRLKLTRTRTVVTDPEPYPVAYLKVEQAELEPKEGWTRPTSTALRDMLGLNEEKGLEGLDEDGRERLEELGERKVEESKDQAVMEGAGVQNQENENNVQFIKKGRWFSVSVRGQSIEREDVGQELKKCFDSISAKLNANNLSLPLQSAHITLLLSSMSLFVPANDVYKTYFGTSPPSRATVAVPLATGRVHVEVVGFDDTFELSSAPFERRLVNGRSALHVQGQSYWAPANIGPYSQSVLVASRLHIAGQIPLIPASLTLPSAPPLPASPYPHQATLALQHVARIFNAQRSRNSTGGGWEGWVESAVGWWARTEESGDGVNVIRDAWAIWTKRNNAEKAPVMFLQALQLPKGALVEYQVNLHTGRSVEFDRAQSQPNSHQDYEEEEDEVPEYVVGTGEDMLWESCQTRRMNGGRAIFFLKHIGIWTDFVQLDDGLLTVLLAKAITIRVYHVTHLDSVKINVIASSLGTTVLTFIPVLSIHNRSGQSFPVALEVFGV
ncbi:hypothetical protein L204_106028 [Cryptococcus depauperatus]